MATGGATGSAEALTIRLRLWKKKQTVIGNNNHNILLLLLLVLLSFPGLVLPSKGRPLHTVFHGGNRRYQLASLVQRISYQQQKMKIPISLFLFSCLPRCVRIPVFLNIPSMHHSPCAVPTTVFEVHGNPGFFSWVVIAAERRANTTALKPSIISIPLINVIDYRTRDGTMVSTSGSGGQSSWRYSRRRRMTPSASMQAPLG